MLFTKFNSYARGQRYSEQEVVIMPKNTDVPSTSWGYVMQGAETSVVKSKYQTQMLLHTMYLTSNNFLKYSESQVL